MPDRPLEAPPPTEISYLIMIFCWCFPASRVIAVTGYSWRSKQIKRHDIYRLVMLDLFDVFV